MNRYAHRRPHAGFTLIEVLVALVVLLVGLLGLVGLQARGQQAEMESYQRTQALVLLQDMVDRINANRAEAVALTYVTGSELGGGGALTDCAGKTGADLDLCQWDNLLKGAAEIAATGTCGTTGAGSACIGAMIGARGCIAYSDTNEVTYQSGANAGNKIPGTGIYTVSVAWQGLNKTKAPPSGVDCGMDQYGDETLRRVVTVTLRLAALGNF
jgi:type IV pilus assembly protein PilV